MIRCGGCGREIDVACMEDGTRFLCARCLHLEIAGPVPHRALGHKAFTAAAAALLALLFLTGALLCSLYLAGAGDWAWFLILAVLLLVAAISAAAVLALRRNISLLVGSLYLSLGAWALAWRLAPGAGWELSRSTGYGGLLMLLAGAASLYVFVRDARRLPRL